MQIFWYPHVVPAWKLIEIHFVCLCPMSPDFRSIFASHLFIVDSSR